VTNFKDRAREAVKSIPIDASKTSRALTLGQIFDQGFEKGAEWGMRQAVEALRRSRRPETYYESGEWADWLLEKARME
jgi:hypothetical protein